MKKKGIILSADYPFKGDVEAFMERTIYGEMSGKGIIADEEITLRRKVTLQGGLSGLFTKVFRNKELLLELSPEACKLFLNILVSLDLNDNVVKLTQKDSGLGRRLYEQAMLELVAARVIQKRKQPYYWVNITILFMGTINEDQDLKTE